MWGGVCLDVFGLGCGCLVGVVCLLLLLCGGGGGVGGGVSLAAADVDWV